MHCTRTQNTPLVCHIMYDHLWLVWLYHIFCNHLKWNNSKKKCSWPEICALITTFTFNQRQPKKSLCKMGRDSSVSLVNGYRLDGPGIKSWWGQDFCKRLDRPWGPPSLLYNGYSVFPGGYQPGHDADHPSPSSTEVSNVCCMIS
jgi:hypothetical protein